MRMGAAGPLGLLFEYFKLLLALKIKEETDLNLKRPPSPLVYQVRPSSAFLKCLLPPKVFQCIQMWNLI